MKNKNKTKVENFQFISERPKDGELLFGHKEIVSTLQKIVLKSPQSFTIGLFGNWGSGKSSIAETLQSNLKSNDIPLIIFDVWKHEGDALRRTFLKDLDKKLSSEYFGKKYYKENFKLEKNLDSDINIEGKSGYEFKGKKFFNHVLVIFLFILIPLILVALGLWGIGKTLSIESFSFKKILEKLLLVIGGLTIPITFWFKYFNSFIIEKKTTYRKSRIQDPIEFENSFHEILNNLTKKVKKIVVVFDNLDRVSGEKAVEIISTIKTFLEPIDRKNKKDIVFIIPCDSTAIKRHLNYAFDIDDEQYADEFLRKFFNTIIWIPEFYNNELQKLAHDKLKETQIKDFENLDLAALIVLVFDQNPRQIIQFINILLANYLLLKERKIPGFSLKENITQLAKYLLLIQRFPLIMEFYKKTNTYRLKDDIRKSISQHDVEYIHEQYESFIDFIDSTSPWEIESLDLFFKFRLTEFERKFENSTKLIRLLESNRISSILIDNSDKNIDDKKYLDNLDFKSKTVDLSNIAKQKIKTNIYPLTSVNFINGLMELTKHYEIKLNDDAYREFFKKLKKDPFSNYIHRLNIQNILVECLDKIENSRLKESFMKILLDQWIIDFVNFSNTQRNQQKTTNQESFIENFFDLILDEEKVFLFEESKLNSINIAISNHHNNNLEKIKRISNSSILRKKLLTSGLLNQIISNLTRRISKDFKIDYFSNYIDILNTFNKSLFTQDIYTSSISFVYAATNKLRTDYNALLDQEDDVVLKQYQITIKSFNKFYNRVIENIVINKNNKGHFDNIYNLSKSIFIEGNYKNASLFLSYYYLFENHSEKSIDKNDVKNTISKFLNSNIEAVQIKRDLTSSIGVKKLFENSNYLNIVFNRAKTSQDFIEQFYSYFDSTKQQELIEFWIPLNGSKDINVYEEILKNLKYNIPDSDKAANKMLANAGITNLLLEKEKIYDIVFNLDLSKEFDYTIYSNQIINLLCSTNLENHKLGFRQIDKHGKFVVKFDLKKKCEDTLKRRFLLNVNQYSTHIKNILEYKFGISKKEINDFIKENQKAKNSIIDYLIRSQSLDFLIILKGFLYKSNYVDLSKVLLTSIALKIKSNKNQLNVFRNIIDELCSANLKGVEREFLDLMVSYSSNLSYNQFDELIIKIEERLYKNRNKLPDDSLRKAWLNSDRFGKPS
ncbi:P-loop NTPase fold protein [Winogradskyella sp.]|uniref:P-loop NTPase fold protein n=1 Tax=Winogradskyella sp. TaxID=1883156 RepID=UPI002632334E|nr:P-loop NTPase fold protein [Winogradskyella sp.]